MLRKINSTPANAPPPMRMKLTDMEFSATAFIRSSRGTEAGINDCRTGWLNDIAVPAISAVAKTCQAEIQPPTSKTASKRWVLNDTDCVSIRMRRRS